MNKKLVIAAIVLAVCVLAAGIGYPMVKGIVIKKDPINYLMYSATHSKSNAVDASVSGKISIEDEMLDQMTMYMSANPEAMNTFIKSILSEVRFSGRVRYDGNLETKTLKFEEQIGFQYGENQLLSFELGYLDEAAFYRMPELYDQAVVMTKKDIFEMVKDETEIDLNEVNFDKYLDLLDVKSDKDYKALVKNKDQYMDLIRLLLNDLKRNGKVDVTLDNGKVISCDYLEMDMGFEEIIEIYIQLFKTLKEDVHAKALVQKKTLEALNLFQSSGDYELAGVSADELTAMIDQITNDFDVLWNDTLEQGITLYEEMKSNIAITSDLKMNYHIGIAIDSSYQIRQINYLLNSGGMIVDQTIVYNAFGKDVSFSTDFNNDQSISLKKLLEDEAYVEEITADVIQNGITKYLKSEAIVQTIEDIKVKSKVLPDDEKAQIIDTLDYFLNNQDEIINMLLENL